MTRVKMSAHAQQECDNITAHARGERGALRDDLFGAIDNEMDSVHDSVYDMEKTVYCLGEDVRKTQKAVGELSNRVDA